MFLISEMSTYSHAQAVVRRKLQIYFRILPYTKVELVEQGY